MASQKNQTQIEAEIKSIWEDDRLDRKTLAEHFTRVLLALPPNSHAWAIKLDAPYGTGKSFFLNHWIDNLKTDMKPACVVKFDAWSVDYAKDPFIALAAEVIIQIEKYHSKTTGRIAEELGSELAKIAKLAAAVKLPFKSVDKTADKSSEATIDDEENLGKIVTASKDYLHEVKKTSAQITQEKILTKGPLKEHLRVKNALEDFSKHLKKCAEKVQKISGKKLIIIVDELDRCRPSFAISLLERIKHIFNVEGVVFVIATHSDALSKSIKVIYGNDFACNEYLERFFDLTLTLPKPDKFKFIADHLAQLSFDHGGIDKFEGIWSLPKAFEAFSKFCYLNFREEKKSINLAAITWNLLPKKGANEEEYIFIIYTHLFLCCIKTASNPKFFDDLLKSSSIEYMKGEWEQYCRHNGKELPLHSLNQQDRFNLSKMIWVLSQNIENFSTGNNERNNLNRAESGVTPAFILKFYDGAAMYKLKHRHSKEFIAKEFINIIRDVKV